MVLPILSGESFHPGWRPCSVFKLDMGLIRISFQSLERIVPEKLVSPMSSFTV